MIVAALLTALLALAILTIVSFTGCASFGSDSTPSEPYSDIITKTDGLLAYWPLDEKDPGAGKPRPAAAVKGALAPSANGEYVGGLTLGADGAMHKNDSTDLAPTLNGTSGYVEVPHIKVLNPGAAAPFSIELWVKPNPIAGGATQVVISSHEKSATSEGGYEISLVRAGQAHQQIVARVFADNNATTMTVQPTVGAPDDWRHIVLTYQAGGGQALTLYVNVADQTMVAPEPPNTNPHYSAAAVKDIKLRFGAGHQPLPGAGPVNFFAGRVDEVAFYNAALPQATVKKHFEAY
jgi:hypothetical protein